MGDYGDTLPINNSINASESWYKQLKLFLVGACRPKVNFCNMLKKVIYCVQS